MLPSATRVEPPPAGILPEAAEGISIDVSLSDPEVALPGAASHLAEPTSQEIVQRAARDLPTCTT